jgi:hypothetical protein
MWRSPVLLCPCPARCPSAAHCRLGLGTLYARTGQREQARAELSAAFELYRALEMTFWLSQA